MLNQIRPILVTALLGAGASSCGVSAGSSGVDSGRLVEGTWGGDERGVIITASQLHVHIGCTLGDFPAPVEVDLEGRFALDGSYALRAFPVARETLPARITGQVSGRRLSFSIVVNDTVLTQQTTLGPVTVTLGVTPVMRQCPICAKPGDRPM